MGDTKITGSDFLKAAAKGDLATVQQALADGMAADTADSHGNSALMMACARGQREVARTLLTAGADAGHKNRYGLGPRQWATWAHNRDELVSLLA